MKTHQVLFYLLILLLPTQLGKHFWPNWSMVYGIRIDYLSPTIYLTDLIILAIFGLWVGEIFLNIRQINKERKSQNKIFKILIAVGLISGFLIVNYLSATNKWVFFYKLLKILEFFLLGVYIVKNHFETQPFYKILSLAILYSSIIAIFQFLKQGSLNGFFWWLGERTFNASTPGIAQAVINGQLVLRSYATFPHPNVLGGFLAVCLPLIILNRFNFRLPVFILGSSALILTFSQSAWFAFIFSFFIYWLGIVFKKRKVFKNLLWAGIIVSSYLFLLFFLKPKDLPNFQSESLTKRQELNLISVEMIKRSPVFGLGLGNFLVSLPEFYQEKKEIRFLQPVHNLYFLIAAEIGLIGLGLFLWFVLLTVKKLIFTNFYLLIATLAVLFLGFFDHYFYTLQQGQLLACLIFSLSWSSKKC